jgi:hypothetical protein
MAKPPRSPPSSDLNGVGEDEIRNTHAAKAAGQDTGDLARAARKAKARPDYAPDKPNPDDRSS